MAASAVLATAGAPALAQDAPPAAPIQNELVGPPQLRDFTLNGTVTRPAQEPAQAAPPQPRETDSRSSAGSAEPARPGADTAARAERGPQRDDRASTPAELPPPTPARQAPGADIAQRDLTGLGGEPALAPVSAEPAAEGSSGGGVPALPWLIAALALAAAAAWYFLRQRPRESYAGAGSLAFEAPTAAPKPPPAAPPARPAPAPAPSPGPVRGIVSTRLRPWLEIELVPKRAVVDEQKAAIQFELFVFNSGSAPARDVLLEASLFNAGPAQDQQIRLFFDNPLAKGDRIPVIPPLQKVAVSTAVFLPREQVKPIAVEGRQLFVPMIAVNALYAWGRGAGQSSTSFLVGKQTGGEKLAPLRLDLGPRMFRGLAAREYEQKLRK